MIIATIDEAQHGENMENDSSATEVLEMNQEVITTRNKKGVGRSQSCDIILLT